MFLMLAALAYISDNVFFPVARIVCTLHSKFGNAIFHVGDPLIARGPEARASRASLLIWHCL